MNYTKAAQELFITQPAVSQHIRYLEKYYGVSLFSYSGKTLTLTPAGRLLLQKASAMKNDEILLKQSLLTADTGTFSYHFGVTTTIGEFVIARPLARFLRDNPKTGIQMTMANTEELLEGLRRGDYHLLWWKVIFPGMSLRSVYSAQKISLQSVQPPMFSPEHRPKCRHCRHSRRACKISSLNLFCCANPAQAPETFWRKRWI